MNKGATTAGDRKPAALYTVQLTRSLPRDIACRSRRHSSGCSGKTFWARRGGKALSRLGQKSRPRAYGLISCWGTTQLLVLFLPRCLDRTCRVSLLGQMVGPLCPRQQPSAPNLRTPLNCLPVAL